LGPQVKRLLNWRERLIVKRQEFIKNIGQPFSAGKTAITVILPDSYDLYRYGVVGRSRLGGGPEFGFGTREKRGEKKRLRKGKGDRQQWTPGLGQGSHLPVLNKGQRLKGT